MESTTLFRTKIDPLPAGSSRPRWSVMIPTYNCAGYLRETLQSVLAQDLGPSHMQIEVIDDCSTQDDPEQVVRELGQGRVRFFRQPENVGHTRNFDTCIRRSRGELVHILHGDDRIRPGFYQKMNHLFEQFPHIGAAFCRHIFMNEQGQWIKVNDLQQTDPGILEEALERIASYDFIRSPSVVVKREVYEQVGGFDHRLKYGEDWEMWVRIAANFPFGYEPEPLAEVRDHPQSISNTLISTGEDSMNVRKVIDMTTTYLEGAQQKTIRKSALSSSAYYTVYKALKAFECHNSFRSVYAQIREALKMHCDARFLLFMFKMYTGSLYHSLRKPRSLF